VGLSRVRDRFKAADGLIRIYDRPAGTAIWRPRVEAENVILNQWYIDFFGQIMPAPPGGIDISFMWLALGYGDDVTPLRNETGLDQEWTTAVSRLATATAVTPTTVLTVEPLPLKIASGATIHVGANAPVLSAVANPGDTTITVVSYTPSAIYPIGTAVIYTDTAIHVPQRLPNVIGIIEPSDPPFVTASFFLPAAANSEAITFTEAGLLYNANTAFGSHVAFSYTKGGNTDSRVDYILARESDE